MRVPSLRASILSRASLTPPRTVLIAFVVGLLAASVHLSYHMVRLDGYLGDYSWALGLAQALLRGQDPYAFVPDAFHVPYPLPAMLFGMPLLWVVQVGPAMFAGSAFAGISAGVLAWAMIKAGEGRRLGAILLSGVFWAAIVIAQWSPLIVATWFLPVLAPLLVLVKPQIAIPVAFSRAPMKLGLLIAALVLLLSLLIYPSWPWRFLSMVGPYQAIVPALIMPVGPLLLLAGMRWQDERGRLLLLMAVLPLRAFYDMVGLWLVPRTAKEAVALSVLSWPLVVGPLAAWIGMPTGILVLFLFALALHYRDSVVDTWRQIAHRLQAGRAIEEKTAEN